MPIDARHISESPGSAGGSATFSRPGPRLVDGLENLAHILHPNAVPQAPGPILEL